MGKIEQKREYFRSRLDETVSPSEDFYKYSNGTWLKNNPIPPHESSWGTFYVLHEENQVKLKTIVEDLLGKDGLAPGTPAALVRDFYLSAQNNDQVKQTGLGVLADLIKQIESISDSESFTRVLGFFHARGLVPFMHPYVEPDEKDSTKYIFRFEQNGLGLPDRDYYFSTDPKISTIREQYPLHMQTVFSYLHQEAKVESVFELERSLAEVSLTSTERRDIEAQYNKFTFAGLQELAPHMSWDVYFTALGVKNPEELIIDQPKFIARLDQFITEGNWQTIKSYFLWRAVSYCSRVLGEEFALLQFQFYGKILAGTKEIQPKWKRDLIMLDAYIGDALGKLFIDKYFPPQAKEKMGVLIEDLRTAFAQRIRGLTWMSEQTKTVALEKLTKLQVKIGYPKLWKDYKGLVTVPHNLAENMVGARMWQIAFNFNKLGQPIDREEWQMTAPTVNAYAYYNLNEIVFPAGILQPPVFDFEADDAVNYGAIGSIIGHEITHGFDDKGSLFDGDGNMRNWRGDDDKRAFDELAKVMEAQGNNFRVFPDLKLNGKLTLGENIADLGGVEIAFSAFKKALERSSQTEPLEGFTPEQRFFLAYACTETGARREERMRELVMSDPHSPSKFRVNHILGNIDAFIQAFNITPGTPMYIEPKDRVKIW